LAGSKRSVSSALKSAERFRNELIQRGVILVPLIFGSYRDLIFSKKEDPRPAPAAPIASAGVCPSNKRITILSVACYGIWLNGSFSISAQMKF
jgi:hypothetical protein